MSKYNTKAFQCLTNKRVNILFHTQDQLIDTNYLNRRKAVIRCDLGPYFVTYMFLLKRNDKLQKSLIHGTVEFVKKIELLKKLWLFLTYI